jgi:hypothetical protein
MMRSPRYLAPSIAWALLLISALAAPALPSTPWGEADTLEFEPVVVPEDSEEPPDVQPLEEYSRRHEPFMVEAAWLQSPFRAPLSNLAQSWDVLHPGTSDRGLLVDYNRVDELRAGFSYHAQARWRMAPRLGGRLEYATGRRRWFYGGQIEQPLEPGNLIALGFSLTRSTEHPELHLVGDVENSLALLFGRQDYRDYFEREGMDGYLALRWPGITTLSLHGRNDRYRSLEARRSIRSLFHRNRELRANPPIADGEAHVVALRFDRVRPGEPGFQHWVELERAGAGLGGDFEYRRLLADVRSLFKLAPSMSFAIRLVGGSSLGGALPPQRSFTLGGVDGLRAHSFGAFRGEQMALGQAEYTAGIGRFRSGRFDNGVFAIVFVDAGHAWTHPDHAWDATEQRFAVDGGFGLATAEDNLRVYFAKNLQDPDSDFVISARLKRPF